MNTTALNQSNDWRPLFKVLIGVLIALALLSFLSCSSKGPIRYLANQSVYTGFQNNSMPNECRQLHPFHKKTPGWYERHMLKDTFKYHNHKSFKYKDSKLRSVSCFNKKQKKPRVCDRVHLPYNVPCAFSKPKYKIIN
jgi:hypothetical protein